ncbi:MAG: CdaR family protein [Candidatus Brocadiaceae bacterium]|nr:CdaR family protein [Candidatus Brocadiaceae bacterium]
MIREIFTGNLLTKLMALVMAIALWLYVINRHTGDLTKVVKLNISVPEGIVILSQSAEEVIVHLQGPQNIIDEVKGLVKYQKIQANCIVKESLEGMEDQIKRTISIKKEHLNLPNDIKLVSVYPSTVDVLLGKLQKKKLRVNLMKKGEPAIGYEILNEFVFPREVEVTGPLNVLKEVFSINTIPVDIGGVTVGQNRTFPWEIGIDQKVLIKRDNKSVAVPVTCQDEVRLWLQIVEQQDIKSFEKIKIKVLSTAEFSYGIKLQDEFVSVRIKGPRLLLDKLQASDIELYIDVSSLKPPGPYKQPLKYSIPPKTELVGKIPDVHVDIREIASVSEGT